LVQAIGIGLAVWVLYQLGMLIDRAWFGAATPIPPDLSGDLLGAYGEELPYRVVVIGGVVAMLHDRPRGRALAYAAVISALLFALAHLPADLVTGAITDPTRMLVRFGYGLVLAAVYLATGNVMLATVLHAMVDGPILWVAGPHQIAVTSGINWAAGLAVAAWYMRNRSRT
ncbi:MAG: CPBP family intramembrane glutamic endopeptidase, partial [Kofleriaceae bacterium]